MNFGQLPPLSRNVKSGGEDGPLPQSYDFVQVEERYRHKDLPNAMTVDVEDYFQVSAFDKHISRNDWDKIPCRIGRNVDRILENFDRENVNATFFTLGWVAQYHPQIVRAIVDAGHELASHGADHSRVTSLSQSKFRRDVDATRKRLEDVSGTSVIGYRAPSFSITTDTLWAHDVLAECGYRYSSSVFPIRHDHYGFPDAPRFPFHFNSGALLEIPMSTVHFMGHNWPCAGGGYFRILPLAYSKWAIRSINKNEGMPAVFYFHPWELDPEQPRVPGLPAKTRFRHYVNIDTFEMRLTEMLRSFRWTRMDSIFLD